MSGMVGESRVDTAALGRAVVVGNQVGDELGLALAHVVDFDERVRSACPGRSAPGGGLDELDRLRARIAETDRFADVVRRDVLVADGPPQGVGPTSPWLDPDTDSWVVGLSRQLSGSPSVALIDRIVESAPDLPAVLSRGEFTTPIQTQILLNDPAKFFDNWRRAGEGALDAGIDAVLATLGAGATILPGADDVVEAFAGRRPGDDFNQALLAGIRQAASDPDRLATTTLGLEELQADPYRWFGSMLPDLVLEAASNALPMSSIRVARRLPSPPEASVPSHLVLPGRPVGGATIVGSPAPGTGPLPDLELFRRSEGDWAPSEPIVSHRQAPFESPELWVGDLNGGDADGPGRHNNCIDCARATEANWRGQDAVAAALIDDDRDGVPGDRLEDWSGGRFVPATMDDVYENLTELGPGSSALIMSAWARGGAHAYNAVNDRGVVKWIDGQIGEVAPWPPPYVEAVDVSLVIWIDAEGHPQ